MRSNAASLSRLEARKTLTRIDASRLSVAAPPEYQQIAKEISEMVQRWAF